MFSNFTTVADLSDAAETARQRGKLERDYPWMLSEPGWEVFLAGLGRGWKGTRTHRNLVARGRWAATGRRTDAALAWLAHFAEGWRLARERPLVVVAPSAQTGLGAALLRRLRPRSVRLVVRYQGHSASKEGPGLAGRLRYHLRETIERFVARSADLAIPMGDASRRSAVAQGVAPERCISIPFPVPWASQAAAAPLADPPTATFVGRFSPEKGIEVLLEAWPAVLRSVPGARLRLVGDGPLRAALEARVEALGIGASVELTGWVVAAALQRAYAETWAVVLPSLWEEGLGMVLVEAGLMGRAAIGSRQGGIQDVVRDGENGYLVPPGDAPALAEALVRVLGSLETARRLGGAGSAIARAYLAPREAGIAEANAAFRALFG
jgi:colanic acid/amylovoran biosynthesis glycosyltransferase